MLVGPDDLIVRLASADQQIPLIAISSGIREGKESLEGNEGNESEDGSLPPAAPLILQLMPARDVFNRAVLDYARHLKWENVAVIYDSVEGMMMTKTTTFENDDHDHHHHHLHCHEIDYNGDYSY